MFGDSHERNRLEAIIERLLRIIEKLLEAGAAQSAKGKLMPAKIAVGGKGATFVFTEFDGPNGSGNVVKPSGPIVYASDNPAVATVDSNGQVTAVAANPDGGDAIAVISGSDPASPNKVAAADVITVSAAAAGPVAVSATGILTAN